MTNSRLRVKTALNHIEPDRIPIGLELAPEVKISLKEYLDIEDDEKLLKRLGIDIRQVFPDYIGPGELYYDHGVDAEGIDIWGVERIRVKNKFGVYYDIIDNPLKNIQSIEEIESYPWPKVDWFDFDSISGQIERIEEEGEYWIILRGAGSCFECAWALRGFEELLIDMMTMPEIVRGIMEKVTNFFIDLAKESLKIAKGRIDMVRLHDDIGSQSGLFISKSMWKTFLKPYYQRYFSFYSRYNVKKYYHSCGSIRTIIEDLIEIGLDVLNPLQFSAKGFPSPEELKEKYGDRLCFEGGMDVQTFLPFNSVEDIKKETKKLIRILGKNGGYIFESSHYIQPDTKPKNIMAMYDTALRHRY